MISIRRVGSVSLSVSDGGYPSRVSMYCARVTGERRVLYASFNKDDCSSAVCRSFLVYKVNQAYVHVFANINAPLLVLTKHRGDILFELEGNVALNP